MSNYINIANEVFMKFVILFRVFFIVLLFTIQNPLYASVFSIKTIEGVDMIFRSETNGTCMVGQGSESLGSAINNRTVGTITIPSTANGYSVTRIGSYAFNDCMWLTSIKIPNSVTSIGRGAFKHCYDLTSIAIPNSVTNIEDAAFIYCI